MKRHVASIFAVVVSFTVAAHATTPLPTAPAPTTTATVAPAGGLHPSLVTIQKAQAPSAAFQVRRAAAAVTQAALDRKLAATTQTIARDGTKTITFNAAPCSGGGTMSGTLVQQGTVQDTNGSLSGNGSTTSNMTFAKCTNGGTTQDGGPFTVQTWARTTSSATSSQTTQTAGMTFRGNLTTSSSSGSVQITNANVTFNESFDVNGVTYMAYGQLTVNGQTIQFDGDRVTIATATSYF